MKKLFVIIVVRRLKLHTAGLHIRFIKVGYNPSMFFIIVNWLVWSFRPNQVPLFVLEVSEGPDDPDPDKINSDRSKLMKEGVFALNKFMTSTKLPTWEVCSTLGVFLAQGSSKFF